MKNRFLMKTLAVALLAGTLLSTVACAATNEPDPKETVASTTEDSGVETEEDTAYVPDIEKKNYDCDFNIITSGTVSEDFLIVTQEDAFGSELSSAIYERSQQIKDQLGVTCNLIRLGDGSNYYDSIIRNVQAGDDAYQLAYTHAYIGVSTLATSNALYDFYDFESVNLDAPYWSRNLMEEIAIQDQCLLGYNDTCLSSVHCIVFNKALLDANQLESPYTLVRNKTWTFDKLAEMSSVLYVDDGNGARGPEDTYGLTGWGWTNLISFITASDLKMVDRNSSGEYEIAYDHQQEKMMDLIEKIFALYNANTTYFWKSSGGTTISFADGTSLFQLYHSTGLTAFRDKDLRFGILPYPLYDENQENYRTLNWNGLMVVPSVIGNPEMVGDVLELMAYHTGPVKDAYYENLLAAKLAEAPDDVEMLNILWDTQVSDLGLVFAGASSNMDSMLYLIPTMCEKGNNTFSSYLKTHGQRAQKALDQALKQGKYAE